MPNTLRDRVCTAAGIGHPVADADLIGMTKDSTTNQVRLYCVQHTEQFDNDLRTVGFNAERLQL
jgi:hypothetical protein